MAVPMVAWVCLCDYRKLRMKSLHLAHSLAPTSVFGPRPTEISQQLAYHETDEFHDRCRCSRRVLASIRPRTRVASSIPIFQTDCPAGAFGILVNGAGFLMSGKLGDRCRL